VTAPGAEGLSLPLELQRRLATLPSEPPPRKAADAAVLILLRIGAAGLEVLAEQRAEQAGDPWSGQVGLPGGHIERSDQTLRDTVLRELREEVGLLPGELLDIPKIFDIRRARPAGLRVAVFAASLPAGPEGVRKLNSSEVATTFWLPLSALENIESRPRSTVYGQIHVDSVVFEGHLVWGFTLGLLREFASWLDPTHAPGPAFHGRLSRSRSQAL
jgi:8-oxo-dGTP pyrophosphatase MutT (NUDIX family)